MEDIVYWDNEGRSFLYNYLKYAVEIPFDTIDPIEEIKKPDILKKYMKKQNILWIPCEG